MPMRVTLQDVMTRVEAAAQRPEAAFGDGVGWTAREAGLHALQALKDNSTRQALPFLKLACETELASGGGHDFADALALFRLWMDQVVELAGCPECGAEHSRACTMFNHSGNAMAREWIHAQRIMAAPGVLA